MNRNNQWIGITLIVIGLLFLFFKLVGYELPFGSLWPLLLLIPGLLFHFFAFSSRIPGLLVPGGILLTYGFIFMFCSLFGFDWMAYLWPLFIAGPGIGLLEFYIYGERHTGVLIPALILIGIGGVFLFFTLLSTVIPYLIGFVLIAVGAYILFGKRGK